VPAPESDEPLITIVEFNVIFGNSE
jgi:hypothetical protein